LRTLRDTDPAAMESPSVGSAAQTCGGIRPANAPLHGLQAAPDERSVDSTARTGAEQGFVWLSEGAPFCAIMEYALRPLLRTSGVYFAPHGPGRGVFTASGSPRAAT